MTWWWLSRRFRTERGALQAFTRLQAEGKRQHGKLDLGVYRHGEEGETARPARTITVVSHLLQGMETAERCLAQGEDVELHPANLEALILRRARVVAELLEEQAPAGSYAIRRRHGATVNPDGTFEEWAGEG
jgi:hypothetical protein